MSKECINHGCIRKAYFYYLNCGLSGSENLWEILLSVTLPFAIGDFGVTSAYQTVKKIAETALLGIVGPLYIVGVPRQVPAVRVVNTLGVRLTFMDVDYVLTILVNETIPLNQI